MNENFSLRDSCPCCESRSCTTLCRVGFTESPIREHLDSFYSPIGGVEFEYLAGSDYVLNECRNCGLIYQQEIPNESLMFKLYEQWIDPERVFERYTNRHSARYFVWVTKEIATAIEYLDMMPNQVKFLDFALGWGNWCLIAKGFGCDVYGTELSQVRIDRAEASGIKVISWEEIPDYQFDFINAEQVFEHLADPFETLVHLKRALKPGGVIRINVPDGGDIKRRLQVWDWQAPRDSENCLNPVAPLQHINCYTHQVLVKMGQRAGFGEIVASSGSGKTSLKSSVKAIARWTYNLTKPERRRRRKKAPRVFLSKSID
ncbi:MAG: class I SAM-dependent methyltransferase [Chloroflexota bacterium]|nr:class I SAM-dependent methyltransferase [Chloroflexota bacterium]